jgi:hypothetical protein
MKTTRKIWLMQLLDTTKLGVLALGILMILCMPQMTTRADAQNSNHFGWYHGGMAYVAENEIRMKEQKANAGNENNEVNTVSVSNITVDADDNEKEHLNVPEETNLSEK